MHLERGTYLSLMRLLTPVLHCLSKIDQHSCRAFAFFSPSNVLHISWFERGRPPFVEFQGLFDFLLFLCFVENKRRLKEWKRAAPLLNSLTCYPQESQLGITTTYNEAIVKETLSKADPSSSPTPLLLLSFSSPLPLLFPSSSSPLPLLNINYLAQFFFDSRSR